MKLDIKSFLKQTKESFIQEFSSVKLAIALFIFLAIATLIGTVLPEEPMVGSAKLIQKYGLKNYHVLKSIGLTDVFHSWWYLALLTTLGLNLITASFTRVFPKWHLAFAWPNEIKKEEGIKALPINSEISRNDSTLTNIERILRKKHYKTRLTNQNLIAVKGGIHRLGASVTHIGIMILLIGSAISILTGFNGMVQLGENEGFYIADLGQSTTQIKSSEPGQWISPISKMPIWLGKTPPYFIKVNKTWREDYKSGEPKQWYSDLSVFNKRKKEVTRKVIHVNDPLQYMGLDIYQSNWGRFTEVRFNDELATLPVENIDGEETVFVPLAENIGLRLITRNNLLEIYTYIQDKNNTLTEKYIEKIEPGKNIQIGPLNIGYFGTSTLTGLQFKSNPGDYFIYPAIFFIFLGVVIAFGSRKQIWAMTSSDKSKIIIGGNADRAKGRFFQEFEEIVKCAIESVVQ